jgi:hypothetical protein
MTRPNACAAARTETASGMIFGFDEMRTNASGVSGQVAHFASAIDASQRWACA